MYLCTENFGAHSAPRARWLRGWYRTWPSYSIVWVCSIFPCLCYIYTIHTHIGGIGTWPSYSIAIIPDWVLAHVQPSSYPNTLQCTKYGNKKVCNIFWLVVQYIWVNIKLLEKTCVAVKTHLLAYVLQWLLLQVPCLYHVCVPACAILISLCLQYISLCMHASYRAVQGGFMGIFRFIRTWQINGNLGGARVMAPKILISNPKTMQCNGASTKFSFVRLIVMLWRSLDGMFPQFWWRPCSSKSSIYP